MKKLTKSRNNKMISGVLAGIAEYFGFDPSILRILYAIAIFFGFGSPIILYIILAIVIPEAPGTGQFKDFHTMNKKPRKEAEKVKEAEKTTDDDWSDF